MNERIKSLLAKAHLDVMEDLSDIDSNQVAERFAELIVKECARIGELKEQGYSEYDPDISVGWYMRQHFGVDGMSTEDKKTLIKELLGVKNETNQ
jgi:hypothetical protein